MKSRTLVVAAACAVAMSTLLIAGPQSSQQKPQVKIPDPQNAQIMSLEDQYVRVAYNNEGYVILGYRVTNELVGKEWIRLEVGTTLRENKPRYSLKRTDITLDTPDNKHLSLPTNAEFGQQDLRSYENLAKGMSDPIDYFPPTVKGVNKMAFFAEPNAGMRAYDETDIDPTRACVGRLFFKIPGGLQYGQHFLNVQFASSKVRVPFRIFTKDEAKVMQKNWKDIKKQVEEAFKTGRGGN